MFSQDDLRDLGTYLKEFLADQYSKEEEDKKPDEEEMHVISSFRRQLEALRYNPLLVTDLFEQYDLPSKCIGAPLEEVPLHINDSDLLSQAIVRWRCNRGV